MANEPVLNYDALHAGQQFPSVPCVLDDAFVSAYLLATGNEQPIFSERYAPPLCTGLVRFVKGSLGGRWPTGTVHLSQDTRLVRPLQRGESLAIDVRIGRKYTRNSRRYLELLATTRDADNHPVVHNAMLMLWAGAAASTSAARSQSRPPRKTPAPELKQEPPAGMLLAPIGLNFPATRLHAYGEVAAARDAIHLDPDYARQTRFGKNIAQGLLVLTLLSQLLTQAFQERWLSNGTLQVRFVKPVFVDDRITAGGVLRDDMSGHCDVWCENQRGERVIEGTADVTIPSHC